MVRAEADKVMTRESGNEKGEEERDARDIRMDDLPGPLGKGVKQGAKEGANMTDTSSGGE